MLRRHEPWPRLHAAISLLWLCCCFGMATAATAAAAEGQLPATQHQWAGINSYYLWSCNETVRQQVRASGRPSLFVVRSLRSLSRTRSRARSLALKTHLSGSLPPRPCPGLSALNLPCAWVSAFYELSAPARRRLWTLVGRPGCGWSESSCSQPLAATHRQLWARRCQPAAF